MTIALRCTTRDTEGTTTLDAGTTVMKIVTEFVSDIVATTVTITAEDALIETIVDLSHGMTPEARLPGIRQCKRRWAALLVAILIVMRRDTRHEMIDTRTMIEEAEDLLEVLVQCH